MLRLVLLLVLLAASADAAPCTGTSARLPGGECAAWASVLGALGGPSTCRATAPCDCGGVVCAGGFSDGKHHIVVIELQEDASVDGTIPAAVFGPALPKLREFVVQSTKLHGTIPATLSSAPALTRFAVKSCFLGGTIPADLGRLADTLVHFSIYNNKIAGELPPSLPALTKLQVLDTYHNKLTGPMPEDIGKMAALEVLQIDDNWLSGSIPASIGACTALRELALNMNMMGGTLPSSLGQLTQLEKIIIYEQGIHREPPPGMRKCGPAPGGENEGAAYPGVVGTGCCEYMPSKPEHSPEEWAAEMIWERGWRCSPGGFTGTLPDEMANLKALKHLWIDENEISGTIPSWLGDLPLWQLDLFRTRMTGTIPASFQKLSHLHTLKLEFLPLGGTIPDFWDSMPRLGELNLRNSSLTGTLPATLGSCAHLAILDVSQNDLEGPLPPGLVKHAEDFAPATEHERGINPNTGKVDTNLQGYESHRLTQEYFTLKINENARLTGRVRVSKRASGDGPNTEIEAEGTGVTVVTLDRVMKAQTAGAAPAREEEEGGEEELREDDEEEGQDEL